ncbi:unnamed protein product [Phaeothamnion confervicola]
MFRVGLCVDPAADCFPGSSVFATLFACVGCDRELSERAQLLVAGSFVSWIRDASRQKDGQLSAGRHFSCDEEASAMLFASTILNLWIAHKIFSFPRRRLFPPRRTLV